MNHLNKIMMILLIYIILVCMLILGLEEVLVDSLVDKLVRGYALVLVVKFEGFDYGEVRLEVWDEFVSRYVSSFSKDVKGGVNVRIDENVVWGFDRSFGAAVFRCVDCEVNMSKVHSRMWVPL